MTSIPASYSVVSKPSVLATGGNALDLLGLVLTRNARVPIGAALSFPNGATVASFFGSGSHEDVIASGGLTSAGNPAGTGYFGGSLGATQIPGALLFVRYPDTAVAAWLTGGNVGAALTLAQLQALSGSLTVVMDGYSHVISSISFAADNSFSAVASAIQAAFTDPTESTFTASFGATFTATGTGTSFAVTSVTGHISKGDTVTGTGVPGGTTILAQLSGPAGGAGTYTTSQATTAGSASCTASSNVLNVTADTDNSIAVGQTVVGAGVAAGVVITALGTGAGGIGTYVTSSAQIAVAAEAMTGQATAPTVVFDSVSGAFVITSGITGAPSTSAFATGTLAASLFLTQATGATLSQGAAATTPGTFMDSIVNNVTTNWASVFTAFDPDNGSGNTQKLAFAAWTNKVAPRYLYLDWDTDITATGAVPATSSQGYIINVQNKYSGTALIYEPVDLNHAPFVAGAIAAIDFDVTGGRTDLAYRTQTGLGAAVTSQAAAFNLGGNPQAEDDFGNGYNFVGFFSLPKQTSINFQRGTVSGPYQWIDSYVNQIWLSAQFQSVAYNYMLTVRSFPYTPAGYSNFELAMQGVIDAGLNFGAYAGGVTLSPAEIVAVNTQAGANIATTLQTQGYYFQVLDPGPTVRQSRGSPIVRFWYVDEGSVQSLTIGSESVT